MNTQEKKRKDRDACASHMQGEKGQGVRKPNAEGESTHAVFKDSTGY
ncbi:hypothetical protein JOC94_002956 [Bacillus thermophilus]|uniref:Uncharacterized protein n=1 Tax=Siminovitchia thermophila TaxID=1245522 RepID=A0ABS2R8H1_9BACI|nr:hypothetical protein [Siminovitchia thermophila]